jgi:hypothetical protein
MGQVKKQSQIDKWYAEMVARFGTVKAGAQIDPMLDLEMWMAPSTCKWGHHDWHSYVGFTEAYEYCADCGEKRHV